MDYDCALLPVYFREMGYSKEKVQELLDTNPFDVNYVIWEKRRKNAAKTVSIQLKQNHIIDEDESLQEVCVHPDASVIRFLGNNKIYQVVSFKDYLPSTRVRRDTKVLINGLFRNEDEFLNKLVDLEIPFITTCCTRDMDYFERYKRFLYKVNSFIQGDIKYFRNEDSLTAVLIKK